MSIVAADVDPASLVDRARALQKEKKQAEAVSLYREIITNYPGSHAQVAYKQALRGLARLRDWEQTATLARQATIDYPNFAVGHQFLGEAFLAKGRHAEAILSLQTAISLDPLQADSRALLQLAQQVPRTQTRLAKLRPWPNKVTAFENPS